MQDKDVTIRPHKGTIIFCRITNNFHEMASSVLPCRGKWFLRFDNSLGKMVENETIGSL